MALLKNVQHYSSPSVDAEFPPSSAWKTVGWCSGIVAFSCSDASRKTHWKWRKMWLLHPAVIHVWPIISPIAAWWHNESMYDNILVAYCSLLWKLQHKTLGNNSKGASIPKESSIYIRYVRCTPLTSSGMSCSKTAYRHCGLYINSPFIWASKTGTNNKHDTFGVSWPSPITTFKCCSPLGTQRWHRRIIR